MCLVVAPSVLSHAGEWLNMLGISHCPGLAGLPLPRTLFCSSPAPGEVESCPSSPWFGTAAKEENCWCLKCHSWRSWLQLIGWVPRDLDSDFSASNSRIFDKSDNMKFQFRVLARDCTAAWWPWFQFHLSTSWLLFFKSSSKFSVILWSN